MGKVTLFAIGFSMENISLPKELLRQILTEAYTAGWEGNLECRSSAIEQLMIKHTSKRKKETVEPHPIYRNGETIVDGNVIVLTNSWVV